MHVCMEYMSYVAALYVLLILLIVAAVYVSILCGENSDSNAEVSAAYLNIDRNCITAQLEHSL